MTRIALLALALTAFLVGCKGGQFDVDTAVKHVTAVVNTFDTSEEAQCQLAGQSQAQVGKQMKRSSDRALQNKLQSIVNKIRRANNLYNFSYQVTLLQSAQANAFTPGCGVIYVTEGLIEVTQTEAQMAMVLAHEMAHGEEAHVAEQQRDLVLAGIALQTANDAVSTSLGEPGLVDLATALSSQVAFSQYSQSAELEADEVGLRYYVNAGYTPIHAPKVFQRMGKLFGSNPAFMNAVKGSHPLPEARADRLHDMVQDMPNADEGITDTTEWQQLTRSYRGVSPI